MARPRKKLDPQRKELQPTEPPRGSYVTDADVSALIRLIDHCKRSGLSIFEGPNGLRFAFKRDQHASPGGIKVSENWIP